MAEVLAPIVQPTTSITMLHTPADAYQNNPSNQSHHPSPRSSQMPRTQYYNTPSGGIGYRGTSGTPVQTYAFQQTPQLRQENRSTSAPVNPYQQAIVHANPAGSKPGHPTHPSSSSGSTASSSSSSNRSLPGQRMSKDDSIISSHQRAASTGSGDALTRPSLENRPLSAINLSTSVPDLSFSNFDLPSKPSPDRYRRSRVGPASPTVESPQTNRSAAPSGSGMGSVAHLYKGSGAGTAPFRPGHVRTSSADDSQLPRSGSSEQAKRYRRRSFGGLDGNLPSPSGAPPATSGPTWVPTDGQEANAAASVSRTSLAERNASKESISTAGSATRPSSAKRESPQNTPRPSSPKVRQEAGSPNIPPRASSGDKKLANPSPLSKPATEADQPRQQPRTQGKAAATAVEPNTSSLSPAAQQLSALSDKDPNKGVKSRLRRAFSFGSAAELRRASAENQLSNNLSAERNRLRKEPGEEVNPEDAAIAAQQEAAGIGEGIYSGQGGVFSGSTDNLSISSTASSASIMLRKMGKGMKKGGRSLKGLFRPKSVIGVPAADSAITQPSMAQVSMVTVEAEREKVNVNVDPHERTGGGTGFPKLERNSIDTSAHERPSSVQASGAGVDGFSRKSIVGGERERAEVLAAVKKGILKRTVSDSQSPVVRPSDVPGITHSIDTSGSSAPSTPGDEQPQAGQMNLSSSDYFIGSSRIGSASTKSLPTTPHGGPRNISFSPRIQFHDAWSASEYDRRGDIATCNRLTPMLAQQIKEELNTFKMEMEVHELSKPHTHFF